MIRSPIVVFLLLTLFSATFSGVFAQGPPSSDAGSNCDMPYGLDSIALKPSLILDDSLNPGNPLSLQSAVVNSQLANLNAELHQLKLENLRLKLALQQLQVEQARALLEASENSSQSLVGEANVVASSIWRTRSIPVAWENPSEENAEEREWVRLAISNRRPRGYEPRELRTSKLLYLQSKT